MRIVLGLYLAGAALSLVLYVGTCVRDRWFPAPNVNPQSFSVADMMIGGALSAVLSWCGVLLWLLRDILWA